MDGFRHAQPCGHLWLRPPRLAEGAPSLACHIPSGEAMKGCWPAGVPVPVRILRHLQAGPLLLLPAGAQAHLALLAAGERHAHVQIRAAPRLQLHGRHRPAARQELLPGQRCDRDSTSALPLLHWPHAVRPDDTVLLCCLSAQQNWQTMGIAPFTMCKAAASTMAGKSFLQAQSISPLCCLSSALAWQGSLECPPLASRGVSSCPVLGCRWRLMMTA